jgi:hypothetical protein
MNRFAKTALAIAAAGSAAQAGTGDGDWKALDSEISGLAASLKPSQDGSGWAVLLRAVYSFSSDELYTSGGVDPDLSGFAFNDVDIAFWGSQSSYSWRVSADLDGNSLDDDGSSFDDIDLQDAYIRFKCGEYFDATMGNYKPRLTLSNSVDPEHQILIDRSVLGSSADFWDNGIGVSGGMEQFAWYAGLMNGSNGTTASGSGQTRDHLYFVRGEFNLGTGAGMYEGAMGSSDTLNGTAGLTFVLDETFDFAPVGGAGGDFDNDGDSDNTAWIVDFAGSVSNIGFGAEVALLDDDFIAATDEDYSDSSSTGNVALVLAPDSTPWSVYGSYMISPEWEVAVRYEDLDNSEFGAASGPDNTILAVGANWYRGTGGKWQAQWSMVDADSNFDDGNILEIGYAVGMTR